MKEQNLWKKNLCLSIARVGVVKQTSWLLEDVLPCSELTHFTHSTQICQAGLQSPDKGLLFGTLRRLLSHMPLLLQVQLTSVLCKVQTCSYWTPLCSHRVIWISATRAVFQGLSGSTVNITAVACGGLR